MSGASQQRMEPTLEKILGQFVEETDDLMTVVDREARFVYVNQAACRVFGLEAKQCIGRSAWDFCHELDRERTRRAFLDWTSNHTDPSYTFWNRQVAVDGTVRHMHWRIQPHLCEDGRPRYLASIARDITALKAAERESKRAETRLRALFSGMLDAVVTIDGHGKVLDASDSVRDVLGYQVEDLVGRNVKVLMPEPYASEHDQYLARYRETGQTWILNTTRQFEIVRKDGRHIHIELSVSRIDIEGEGEPVFCGSFRDVTARLAAERALSESERRFRAIFDQEFQYVGLLRPDGTLLEVNRSALERTGVARDQVIGRPFWDMHWWSHDPLARERMRDAVQRAANGEFVRFEAVIRTANEVQRTLDFSLKPLRNDEGQVTLLIPEGRDITEIKASEEREHAMLRSLAALGESASILAHEIKNPITAVNLALRAVADQLGEDHSAVLGDLVGRMQQLEQRLRRALSFTRPVVAQPRRVRVQDLFASSINLLAPEAEANEIGVSTDVEADLAELWVDPELAEEVLTNLLRNSLDVLPRGGQVRFVAKACQQGERELIEVFVEDDGPGVPARIRGDLFKPFFTTKESGTGLGLAIARKVIEEQDGSLQLVEEGPAEPGRLAGACFRICLPAAQAVPRMDEELRSGA